MMKNNKIAKWLLFEDSYLYTTTFLAWALAICIRGFSTLVTFGLSEATISNIVIAFCAIGAASAAVRIGGELHTLTKNKFVNWLGRIGNISITGMMGSGCLMVLCIEIGANPIVTKASMFMVVLFMSGILVGMFHRNKTNHDE